MHLLDYCLFPLPILPSLCMFSIQCPSLCLSDWLSVPSVYTVDSAPVCLTGCLCPLCVQLIAPVCTTVCRLTDWLSVPSQCTVDRVLLCAPCLTGCLCPLYIQLTGNQTDGGHTGALGHCQLYIQRAQTTSQTGALWGTVYCKHRGHWQPAGLGACWAQRAQTTRQGDTHSGNTENTEGTYNPSNRDPLGHCLTEALTTRPTGGIHSRALSTVHSEGTDNQSVRGQTGAVNCTYRMHRQPVRQGLTGTLFAVYKEGTGSQSDMGHCLFCLLLFCILATSKVISVTVPTCDSAHSW